MPRLREYRLTLLLLGFLLLPTGPHRGHAALIHTLDGEGISSPTIPSYEKSPAAYIPGLREALRRGDLTTVGAITRQIRPLAPGNVEIAGMHAIYLASVGDQVSAWMILDQLQGTADAGGEARLPLRCAQAMAYRLEGKPDKAREAARRASDADPTHPYPWNILGRIETDEGRYGKALDRFKQAMELEPAFLPAYTNAGAAAYMGGYANQAVEFFRAAIQRDSRAAGARYGLAVLRAEQGELGAAREALEKLLGLQPNHADALALLAQVQLRSDAFEDAIDTGKRLVQAGRDQGRLIQATAALRLARPGGAAGILQAGSPPEAYLLGLSQLAAGEFGLAERAFDAARAGAGTQFGAQAGAAVSRLSAGEEIDPGSFVAGAPETGPKALFVFVAGSIEADRGNWETALGYWASGDGLLPGYTMTGLELASLRKTAGTGMFRPLTRGVLLLLAEFPELASIEFDKARSAAPTSPLVNFWSAHAQLALGHRTEAAIRLQAALDHAPRFFSALTALGDLRVLEGDRVDAIRLYREAIAVKVDLGVLLKLALVFEEDDRFAEAETVYRRVIELNPGLFVGYNQLAWSLARRGEDLEEAIRMAKKALELAPGDANVLDTLLWATYRKGDLERALEISKQLEAAGNRNPTVLYHRGEVYQALGRPEEAREVLKEALAVSDKFPEAEKARTLLSKL